MTVTYSAFVHNSSFNDWGGAIINAGTLTVIGTIFFQNEGGTGGAIYSSGSSGFFAGSGVLTIRDSVFLENRAIGFRPFFDGHGGGIHNHGGTVDIVNTLISQNSASHGGGGLYTCCGGTTTLRRTVVTGNSPDDIIDAR
jgi:predicted outer membrane repeat protein